MTATSLDKRQTTHIRMTVEWFVPLGQARSLTMALHGLMTDIRAVHGCLGCYVSTGMFDQGTVSYIEEWRTEEDLRRRLQSDMFSVLAALIEGSIEHPKIEFLLPGGTRGLDFVEEVRGLR